MATSDVNGPRRHLAPQGMYRPDFESDACGVRLVAAIDGRPSGRVVQSAIDALRDVRRQSAVDADHTTGDGDMIRGASLVIRAIRDIALTMRKRLEAGSAGAAQAA